jgi:hypothetical protein
VASGAEFINLGITPTQSVSPLRRPYNNSPTSILEDSTHGKPQSLGHRHHESYRGAGIIPEDATVELCIYMPIMFQVLKCLRRR